MNKTCCGILGAKNNDRTLKNRLSLFYTLWNIENAAIPTNKTIAVHAWVHLLY